MLAVDKTVEQNINNRTRCLVIDTKISNIRQDKTILVFWKQFINKIFQYSHKCNVVYSSILYTCSILKYISM
jgi:hypothetical protein